MSGSGRDALVATALTDLARGALAAASAAIHAASAATLAAMGVRGLPSTRALACLQVELHTLAAMHDTVVALQKLPNATTGSLDPLQRAQVRRSRARITSQQSGCLLLLLHCRHICAVLQWWHSSARAPSPAVVSKAVHPAVTCFWFSTSQSGALSSM